MKEIYNMRKGVAGHDSETHEGAMTIMSHRVYCNTVNCRSNVIVPVSLFQKNKIRVVCLPHSSRNSDGVVYTMDTICER